MNEAENVYKEGASKPDQVWAIIAAKVRVDSSNHNGLIEEVKKARAEGHNKIALDLKQNCFLNYPIIQFCVEIARELAGEGGGFAVIAASERVKRHIEIYGSLNQVQLVRKSSELKTD